MCLVKCCYFLRPCTACSVVWVLALVAIVFILIVIGVAIAAVTALVVDNEKQTRTMIHRGAMYGVPIGLFVGLVVVALHLLYMHTCHVKWCLPPERYDPLENE